MRFIEGQVASPSQKDLQDEIYKANITIRDLEQRVRVLEGENDELSRQLRQVPNGVTSLRRTLSPLYHALQQVFGDLNELLGADDAPVDVPSSKTAAIWAIWKQKLSPACGKIIDALLDHGQMTAAQLKVAARLGTSTVSESVGKMRGLGLLDKSPSGVYSLKKLS